MAIRVSGARVIEVRVETAEGVHVLRISTAGVAHREGNRRGFNGPASLPAIGALTAKVEAAAAAKRRDAERAAAGKKAKAYTVSRSLV
ncbi:MAG TPA: hypothetical protein VD838_21190 [Anaeromyxobacteraceae bacterium]|nr:hypothetical protein [Anaeromyxobacteraceae bacterium]